MSAEPRTLCVLGADKQVVRRARERTRGIYLDFRWGVAYPTNPRKVVLGTPHNLSIRKLCGKRRTRVSAEPSTLRVLGADKQVARRGRRSVVCGV